MYDNEYKERAYQWWKDHRSYLENDSLGHEIDLMAIMLNIDEVTLWHDFEVRSEKENDSLEKIKADADALSDQTCRKGVIADSTKLYDGIISLIDRTIVIMERDKQWTD